MHTVYTCKSCDGSSALDTFFASRWFITLFARKEINIMCMKHLDSDCTFAHFAALDLQVEGSKLWRKLQVRG